MALSADQTALLELILQKGQGYADIAGLLDVPEDEVRRRARGALTELGGADPDRNVGLTDWVLGQADPIGRADAVRHVREDAADHRLATTLVEELRALAPGAELPKLPPEPSGRFGRRPATPSEPTPRAPTAEPSAAGERPAPGEHRTRLIAALGAGALILVVAVLAITGTFGGGDDESSASSSASTETTPGVTEGPEGEIQTVELRPTGGGDASGTATFGIATNQAYVDLDVSNLEPAPNGKAYVLWLLVSGTQGHPLTPFQVQQGGSYNERIPIASFLTQLAARTQEVDISLSPRKPLLTAVEDAVQQGTPIIDYTGKSVMRGEVPAGTASGQQ